MVVVNPAYPSSHKAFYGMVDDPVSPATIPAVARTVAWCITAVTIVATIAWASTLNSDSTPLPKSLAWLVSIVIFAGLFAPKGATKLIIAQQKKARLRIQANGASSARAADLVGQTQADAIRFGQMIAKQPALAALGLQTSQTLAWLVWHAAQRAIAVGSLETELDQAGHNSTGPAKAAWLADQNDKIAELCAPIARAAQQVRQLADLAEDTTWAARLALEVPGAQSLPTVTGPDVVASADITEAMAALNAWHTTWVQLDERLRAAGQR